MRSRDLDLMILLGPFPLEIFCDSMITSGLCFVVFFVCVGFVCVCDGVCFLFCLFFLLFGKAAFPGALI